MKNQQWSFNEVVPETMAGQSLKVLLSQYWQLPKHLVYSVRHAKRVLVNDRYQPVNFPVKAGDHIHLTFTPADFANPFPNVLADSAATVEILYEDDNLVVVNKRRGDKTHPNQPGEVGATINHLAAYLATEATLPYIIHRLDQRNQRGDHFSAKIRQSFQSWWPTLPINRFAELIWPGYLVQTYQMWERLTFRLV